MTNEKFAMTDFQFRLSALVASLRIGVFLSTAASAKEDALKSAFLIEWIRLRREQAPSA
jgi:hypothetical protein